MEHLEDTWAATAVSAGLAALTLRRLGDTSFEGDSLPMPGGRVFGGQVLAQALLAAGATVDDDRPAHSLHGYFLRPGDATKPISFEVEILRDGRSFSARRTHAIQNGKPILSMIASFQEAQEGPEHSVTMPDRKSTRLNSSHVRISYAVFCLKKKKETTINTPIVSY